LTVVVSVVFGALAAGWLARAFVAEIGSSRRALGLTLGIVDVVFLLLDVLVLGGRFNLRVRLALGAIVLVANGLLLAVYPDRHYMVY
jgi:hypothetical protein